MTAITNDRRVRGPRDGERDPLWAFSEAAWTEDESLLHYTVFATDTQIGIVELAVNEPGRARLEVGVRRQPAGGRRVIPAGVIAEVDHHARMVMLNLAHQRIEQAPTVAPDEHPDDWRERLEHYYRPFIHRGPWPAS